MKSPANPIDRPPSWAVSFLEWFCPDELQESILGDLLEQFDQDRDHLGRRRARQLFALNVLRFFRPSLIARNQFNLPFMHTGILKNHLRVAFRSMKRYTFYSLVNLLGLSLAIAFVFLMYAIALFGFHIFNPDTLARQVAINQMPTGMIVLNLQGQITSLNPAARRLLGLTHTDPPAPALHQFLPLNAVNFRAAEPDQLEVHLGGPAA